MWYSRKIGKLTWHARNDFRAKATFGVASAALLLLLPIALLDFYQGKIAIGIGSLGIVYILGANAWMVTHGRCHQNLRGNSLSKACHRTWQQAWPRD